MVLLLLFNAAAYLLYWSEIFVYNDTPKVAQLEYVQHLPMQTLLLFLANAFVVSLAIFFFFFEKFRDKEEDKATTENKREARRRYYRRRSERRKQGKTVPA
jgi:hypothetical protein